MIIKLFITFVMISFTTIAQNIDVIYLQRYDIDTLNIKNLPVPIQNNLKRLAKGENYVLSIRQGASYYRPKALMEGVIENTSEKQKDKDGVKKVNKTIINNYQESVWKNRANKNIYSKILSNGNDYLVQGDFADITWELLQDTKTISGIECNHAKGKFGNKFVDVWYSSSVPINDGPSVYCGLPGLILQYSIGKRIVFAQNIIKNVDDTPLPLIPDGTFISREEYTKQTAYNPNKSGTTKNGNTTTSTKVIRH